MVDLRILAMAPTTSDEILGLGWPWPPRPFYGAATVSKNFSGSDHHVYSFISIYIYMYMYI